MRLTILFLLLLIRVCWADNNCAQNAKISIDAQNQTIAEILETVEQQSEFSFIYDSKSVDTKRKVSVQADEENIFDVLSQMFAGSEIAYTVINNKIILNKSEEILNITQQVITVSGIVTDEKGEPIIGASVALKGTTNGTVTDINGRFSLDAPDNGVLFVSYLGYNNQEIAVGGRRFLSIILTEKLRSLDEVVVIGYGTMKRSDITGSVGSVSKDVISGRAKLNIINSLQGQIPGVMVTQRNGQPGNPPSVRIRGIGTLNNNDPLYIVDGVTLTNENADLINNQDVESIEILKDAASASIYGSRAGNGVILITTKKGTAGKPVVFYDGNVGYNEASNRLNLLNASDYAMISDEALVNAGRDPYWNGSTGRANTDWQDQIFQRGFIQSHSLGFRGSKQDIRYYLSAGYDDQDGTLLETNFKRYSIKSNVDVNITDKLLVGMNLSYMYKEQYDIEQGVNSVLMNAVRMPATVPAYNDDGTLGYPMGNEADGQNPIGYAQRSRANNNASRMLINLFADYKIFPSLIFRSNFSGDIVNTDYSRFSPTFEEGSARNAIASLSESYGKAIGISFENYLTYDKVFGEKHNVTAMIGQSLLTNGSKSTSASKRGFPSNDENMRYFSAGTEQDQVSGNKSEWALLAYFGRLNYNFDNRYLFQFNLRADGSSRFGKNNRWGTFPSGAIGWRLSEERFMKSIDWLSNLKIRGSYGVLGMQPTQLYGFTTNMGQARYILGTGQQFVIGYVPGGMSNDDFKWETSAQTNVGLDVGLFSNKLSFTVEYYNKYTKDILQTLSLMAIAGTGGKLTNIGEMENKGLEFSFALNDRIGKFNYFVNGNFSTLKNEVKKLFDNDAPISSGVTRTEVGHSIGQFYGYVTDGIFQNQAEIDAHGVQPNAVPGDVRFKNLNGDDRIDAEDMTFIGNPIPPFTFGLSLGGDYKGIDFSVFLQGVAGNDMYYSGNYYLINGGNNFNKTTEILNRWQKEGDKTNIPRVTLSSPNDNFRTSDLFIKSGSYMRIANIQLGYTLKPVWINKIGVQSARFYVSANNLLTFTKYPGYDPELDGGNDQITYPVPRTVLFGINLTF